MANSAGHNFSLRVAAVVRRCLRTTQASPFGIAPPATVSLFSGRLLATVDEVDDEVEISAYKL